MQDNRIGLIGCGAMGSAIARGMINKGGVEPVAVQVYDVKRERSEKLAQGLQLVAAPDLAAMIPCCRHIIIAVKPQDMAALLKAIAPLVKPHQLITSIAAGITIQFIASLLPPGSKVIRLMPNTPCLVGEGAIAISSGAGVSAAEEEEVSALFRPLGLVVPVGEHLMNAVTGLSGSGPAYVFLFVEALIDAGVNVGLPREVASALVVQTVFGAAQMLRESKQHPAELRNAVTSPAGTTSAALQVLEEAGVRGSLGKAVMQAFRRAGELQS